MNRLTYNVVGLLCFLILPNLQAQEFLLEKLNPDINSTAFDEIAPCVSADGFTLYFTRVGATNFNQTLIENGRDLAKTLPAPVYQSHLQQIYSTIAGTPIHDPIHSAFNQDIWMAQSIRGHFDHIYHPSYPFNNALPNSANSFGSHSHELIVINQFIEGGGMKKGFSKIYRKEDGSWTFPEPLSINNYHNSGADVNMTMSSDGQVMIISMERADAIGRSDLYISYRQTDQHWSTPKNLGPGINSLWREATPHLSADGSTLYFSSDRGSQSAGGSDLFVQHRLDETWERWSAPKRFRAPINSTAHDSHPYFNAATGYLYFNSTRDGSNDIYRIQIEPASAKGFEIYGKILNTKDQSTLAAQITIECTDPSIPTTTYFSEEGNFRLRLLPEKEYFLQAHKNNFIGKAERLEYTKSKAQQKDHSLQLWLSPEGQDFADIPTINHENKIEISSQVASEVNLNISPHQIEVEPPIEVGVKVELPPIFFQRSYSIVLKKSYPAINQLARFLKKHPEVSIRISGHTDNQGDERALVQLSEERAATIKDFMIRRHNILPHRITTTGYGGHVPINSNNTESQRQKNRRVEIEIIKVEESKNFGLRSDE